MKKKIKKLVAYLLITIFIIINMAIIGLAFTCAVERSISSGFAFICAAFFTVLCIIGFSIVFWLMECCKELIAIRVLSEKEYERQFFKDFKK